MIFLGIDPGKSGGIAALEALNEAWPFRAHLLSLKDKTERDVADWLHDRGVHRTRDAFAVIEKVASSPQMGVCSAFTFGRSYGFLRGLVIGCHMRMLEVTPQKWQKTLGCMSKGDKNITKAKAQQLYPNEKITHATADALLLATYCKQNHAQLF